MQPASGGITTPARGTASNPVETPPEQIGGADKGGNAPAMDFMAA